MDLDELWKKSSNAPTTPPSRTGSMTHQQVKAVIAGIGPVIREQLDGLRAENAAQGARIKTLETENAALRADNERLHTEVSAEIRVLKAAFGALRLELADALETVDPARRYSGAATQRLLS